MIRQKELLNRFTEDQIMVTMMKMVKTMRTMSIIMEIKHQPSPTTASTTQMSSRKKLFRTPTLIITANALKKSTSKFFNLILSLLSFLLL